MKSGHCDYYKGDCCAQWLIGDGTCDEQNNFPSCNNHDGGDCRPQNIKQWPNCPYNTEFFGDGRCYKHFNNTECNFDRGDCCTDVLIGNRLCDDINNFQTCSYYDGGDCRSPNITEWPKCPHNPAFIGDGTCDEHLKINLECNYDALDCCPNGESVGDGECNPENLNNLCMNDRGDCCNKEIGPGN